MNILETRNYKEMSERACELLIHCLREKPDALFCIATGSSPTETYGLFVQAIKREQIDTGKMRIIKLDEWCGLKKENPATCEYYIRKHILTPLNIPDERYLSFNPAEENEEYECKRISSLITENGGIDFCILGIGKNGHLGLNEPREEINPFTHKTELDSKTKTHSMLVSSNQTVSQGYTLGIKDILDSKKVMLLITGNDKQEAYQNLKKKMISTKYPANYLWLHDQAVCIVDSASMK